MQVSFFKSLRVHILVIVFSFLAVVLTLFTANTLAEFEKAHKASIEHEGLLLSNTLEAGIADLALKRDIASIQSYINRIIALREQNDIEINVIFPVGKKSEIVASNDLGNIESTDEEEHEGMLEALKLRRPILLVDKTSDDIDPDDDPDSILDPSHIDYYIKPRYRFMSIMTPLIINKQELGSINVQLSLGSLDIIIRSLYISTLITMCAGLMVLAVGISVFLNTTLFKPLSALAKNIFNFGVGRLAYNPSFDSDSNRQDEIGVINTEFSSMVKRIRKAEADNQAYLGEIEHQKAEVEKLLLNILPQSIIERLHTGQTMIADAHSEATVLFADLVGFTQYAASHSPEQVVIVLNEIFLRFDHLALVHGVEKIKTIGDSYMGVSGVPIPYPDHSERAARTALGMVEIIREMNKEGICDFQLRIGLHSGQWWLALSVSINFLTMFGATPSTSPNVMKATASRGVSIYRPLWPLHYRPRSILNLGGKLLSEMLGKSKAFFLND